MQKRMVKGLALALLVAVSANATGKKEAPKTEAPKKEAPKKEAPKKDGIFTKSWNWTKDQTKSGMNYTQNHKVGVSSTACGLISLGALSGDIFAEMRSGKNFAEAIQTIFSIKGFQKASTARKFVRGITAGTGAYALGGGTYLLVNKLFRGGKDKESTSTIDALDLAQPTAVNLDKPSRTIDTLDLAQPTAKQPKKLSRQQQTAQFKKDSARFGKAKKK